MPNEEVIIWEAPKIISPEFRLYYDDKGKVVCYTCEKLAGNYIVIDKDTYAEGRPDVRVVDGNLVKLYQSMVVAKLELDNAEGIPTSVEDISIIVNQSYTGRTNNWKLKLYEL